MTLTTPQENKSLTPRQDYLLLSKDFLKALQEHIRQFEDNPDSILDRELLRAAYRLQSTIIQQHFSALSILYDREFIANTTPPEEAINEDLHPDCPKHIASPC